MADRAELIERLEATNPELQQQLAWKEREIAYILPKLRDDVDKAAVLDVIEAGWHQSSSEGIQDAIDIVGRIRAATAGDRARVLGVIINALIEYNEANERDYLRSLEAKEGER